MLYLSNYIIVQTPVQLCPSPVNPDLHVQVKCPIVSWQSAFVWQSWGPELHSLISERRINSCENC